MKKNLVLRIILDAICWFGTGGILFYYQFPTLSALFVTGGLITLFYSIRTYIRILKMLKMVEALDLIIEEDQVDKDKE